MEIERIKDIELKFELRVDKSKNDMLGVSDYILAIIKSWGFNVSRDIQIKSKSYEGKIYGWEVIANVDRII